MEEEPTILLIYEYVDNLRKLKALKNGLGCNNELTPIPINCRAFSKKLESLGINHYAEGYIGTHGNKVCSDDGRILNEMLPFFDTNLNFEDLKFREPVKPRIKQNRPGFRIRILFIEEPESSTFRGMRNE